MIDILRLELGILVWQDFQFACGVYPAHDSFLKSVKSEAIDNIKRLRGHPSLAMLCGNNEGMFNLNGTWGTLSLTFTLDYQMVLQWGGPFCTKLS